MELTKLLEAYNQLIESKTKIGNNIYGKEMKWYYAPHLILGRGASIEDIERIKQHMVIELPEELIEFYQKYAYLTYDPLQKLLTQHKFTLFSPNEIIEKITAEDYYSRCQSLGLIDMIKYSWDNERPECDEMSSILREKINNQFKVIGWYEKHDENENYYIYMDECSKFGVLYYHQDDFEGLEKRLIKMLEQSQANKNLEDIICYALNDLAEDIKENGEKWLNDN